MCRKKLILGCFMVILTLAVVMTSMSFSFNVSQVSGSFMSRTSLPPSDRDSGDIAVVVANIEAAGIQGSVAKDIEKSLSSATGDIYEANMARIAEAEEKARRKAINDAKIASAAGAEARSIASAPLSSSVNFTGLEAQILSLINSTRASHGLSSLSSNQMLTDLARMRSSDMVSRNYFSHYSPDGRNIKHLFADYGVAYSNFGENLGNATPASYGSPKGFLNAWMNSPSHRDNMLKSNYTLIGVGVIDGGGRRVVTVLFIR